MKVNMTPNPLDVVTIHASQGDSEARQWEFELHNNGELIDTSDVTEQLFFKSYKGGTEQILPENTSTPTTSPFKGDIKYPQGLLSDQEFTYRESPTEEDGLAKITDIKGNTLVWNQLNQNGNYVSTSGLTTWGCTISASNNVLTFKATNHSGNYAHPLLNLVSGHKYLVGVTIQKEKAEEMIRYGFEYGFVRTFIADNITTKKRYYQIVESTYTGSAKLYIASVTSSSYTDFGNVYVSDYVCFDLTQMGLDITDPSEFTSLFPLSYYSYNQGSLLSFNGNGIKTVGKNLFTTESGVSSGANFSGNSDELVVTTTATGTYMSCYFDFDIPSAYVGHKISLSLLSGTPSSTNDWRLSLRSSTDGSTFVEKVNLLGSTLSGTFAVQSGMIKMRLFAYGTSATSSSSGVSVTYKQIMLELSDSPTQYEPYTTSTISLPISTYFPNGMKSAGTVYDELTESKAITRIGCVDLGSLTWTYANDTGHLRFVSSTISPNAKLPANNTIANAVCTKYGIVTEGNVYNNQKVGLCIINNSRAMVYDPNYTDATTFKTAMSGVYLYYELATPTETSFTTASLVTENAEIPLSNNDGTLIGKCTEELSAEPGFHDAKIKLSDSDGTCYSNKLQLHVERSPQ